MSTLPCKLAVNILWGLPPFLRIPAAGTRAALRAKLLGRAGGLRR